MKDKLSERVAGYLQEIGYSFIDGSVEEGPCADALCSYIDGSNEVLAVSSEVVNLSFYESRLIMALLKALMRDEKRHGHITQNRELFFSLIARE